MPFRPAFTLGSGGRGHRPAAAVAVSGANCGGCGRGFLRCRSRDGKHRLSAPSAPFSAMRDHLIQCQFPTVIVRSSCSCFSLGTVLKKSSPLRSSTRSTVTTKVRRSALLLNRRLTDLAARLKDRPKVTIEYSVPDERKSGGAYVTVTGRVRNISVAERLLVMEDGTEIPMEDVVSVVF